MEWRKLHKGEINDLYSSPSIVRLIKSRRIRWAEHVARMGERRSTYSVMMGKVRERDHLGYPGVDGRIILKLIFSKWCVGAWTGLSWLRIETVTGTCLQ
jgi:hypothetical protein